MDLHQSQHTATHLRMLNDSTTTAMYTLRNRNTMMMMNVR